jgi:hypothetical protein
MVDIRRAWDSMGVKGAEQDDGMTWGATRRNTSRDLNSKFERLPSDSIYEITACHSSFSTNNADGNVLVPSHKLKRDMAEGHRNLLLGTVA